MKLFGYFSFFVMVLGISCSQSGIEKPNIIFIMADDLGWGDVGFNGNSIVKTPYLDNLAEKGIVLERFYSASPVCSPTRASCITGRNPFRIEIPNANSGKMKEEEITLPEILKKQGYATGHFGKWHLGTLTKITEDANRGGPQGIEHYSIPTMHGYDEYFCTESKVPTYDPMRVPKQFEEGESLRNGWKARTDTLETIYYGTAYWKEIEQKEFNSLSGDDSRVILDRAIPFIEKSVNSNNPFFTTIWFHSPHLPVVADSNHRNYYASLDLYHQIYYGAITAMDEQVGRLWQELEQLGVADNTILWFCSDNGPERDTPGSADIFRERKRSLYEGGVRVPAFVVWKDHLKKGQRMDFPSVTSDYLPTTLDFLGIDYPNTRPIDGESILALLSGEKIKREKPIGFLYPNKMSWVNNEFKLISNDDGQTFELYNLINDKSEKTNIIEDKPEVASTMKKQFFEWRNSVEKSAKGLDY